MPRIPRSPNNKYNGKMSERTENDKGIQQQPQSSSSNSDYSKVPTNDYIDLLSAIKIEIKSAEFEDIVTLAKTTDNLNDFVKSSINLQERRIKNIEMESTELRKTVPEL